MNGLPATCFEPQLKGQAQIRDLGGRLRADGRRVWLDEWEIRPGVNISSKIEEGLESSRVLVLLMSANALGSVGSFGCGWMG
jgi:hypothetical protein